MRPLNAFGQMEPEDRRAFAEDEGIGIGKVRLPLDEWLKEAGETRGREVAIWERFVKGVLLKIYRCCHFISRHVRALFFLFLMDGFFSFLKLQVTLHSDLAHDVIEKFGHVPQQAH